MVLVTTGAVEFQVQGRPTQLHRGQVQHPAGDSRVGASERQIRFLETNLQWFVPLRLGEAEIAEELVHDFLSGLLGVLD